MKMGKDKKAALTFDTVVASIVESFVEKRVVEDPTG